MKWQNVIPLLAAVVILWLVLRYLRPALRAQRHRAWEKAGLLPHQVDPYNPDRSADPDTPSRPDGEPPAERR